MIQVPAPQRLSHHPTPEQLHQLGDWVSVHYPLLDVEARWEALGGVWIKGDKGCTSLGSGFLGGMTCYEVACMGTIRCDEPDGEQFAKLENALRRACEIVQNGTMDNPASGREGE